MRDINDYSVADKIMKAYKESLEELTKTQEELSSYAFSFYGVREINYTDYVHDIAAIRNLSGECLENRKYACCTFFGWAMRGLSAYSNSLLEYMARQIKKSYGYSFPLLDAGIYIDTQRKNDEVIEWNKINHMWDEFENYSMYFEYIQLNKEKVLHLSEMEEEIRDSLLEDLFVMDIEFAIRQYHNPIIFFVNRLFNIEHLKPSVIKRLSELDEKLCGIIAKSCGIIWVVLGGSENNYTEKLSEKVRYEQYRIGRYLDHEVEKFMDERGILDKELRAYIKTYFTGNSTLLQICETCYAKIEDKNLITFKGELIHCIRENFYVFFNSRKVLCAFSCMEWWQERVVDRFIKDFCIKEIYEDKDEENKFLIWKQTLEIKGIISCSPLISYDKEQKGYRIFPILYEVFNEEEDKLIKERAIKFLLYHSRSCVSNPIEELQLDRDNRDTLHALIYKLIDLVGIDDLEVIETCEDFTEKLYNDRKRLTLCEIIYDYALRKQGQQSDLALRTLKRKVNILLGTENWLDAFREAKKAFDMYYLTDGKKEEQGDYIFNLLNLIAHTLICNEYEYVLRLYVQIYTLLRRGRDDTHPLCRTAVHNVLDCLKKNEEYGEALIIIDWLIFLEEKMHRSDVNRETDIMDDLKCERKTLKDKAQAKKQYIPKMLGVIDKKATGIKVRCAIEYKGWTVKKTVAEMEEYVTTDSGKKIGECYSESALKRLFAGDVKSISIEKLNVVSEVLEIPLNELLIKEEQSDFDVWIYNRKRNYKNLNILKSKKINVVLSDVKKELDSIEQKIER